MDIKIFTSYKGAYIPFNPPQAKFKEHIRSSAELSSYPKELVALHLKVGSHLHRDILEIVAGYYNWLLILLYC